MHIIEQISDDKFVVQMDPIDNCQHKRITIAHDYVNFQGQFVDCTNLRPTGPYAIKNSNCVHRYSRVQIDIRMIQDMCNTILKNHKYMQPEHLVDDKGNPRYLYSGPQEYRYRNDSGVEMIAVMDTKTGVFTHIPLGVYNSIKDSIENQE